MQNEHKRISNRVFRVADLTSSSFAMFLDRNSFESYELANEVNVQNRGYRPFLDSSKKDKLGYLDVIRVLT